MFAVIRCLSISQPTDCESRGYDDTIRVLAKQLRLRYEAAQVPDEASALLEHVCLQYRRLVDDGDAAPYCGKRPSKRRVRFALESEGSRSKRTKANVAGDGAMPSSPRDGVSPTPFLGRPRIRAPAAFSRPGFRSDGGGLGAGWGDGMGGVPPRIPTTT